MRKTLLLSLFCAALPRMALSEPMLLAAASTRDAIDAGLAESGIAALTSYGASGVLARQIEQGAPADLFISANPKWMQHLVDLGLIEKDAVSVLMSNRLVLIAPEGSGDLAPDGIAARLDGENFVMADPQTAPVGSYGKTALETLGLWSAIESHFVPTRNTLATVAAVAQGEAALGLVYASDAAGQPGVRVVWTVPADSHPPIRYLIAPLAQGDDPEGATELLDFLLGAGGRVVLTGKGFLPVAEGS
ncbi:molybdate ABC transporter substrate-binding protein [Salipiger sp. P9]|uniref:molybdate ABC transporter substrate-binding protein n=1 Tax=Salipiger pentaromativorans TaxID=2943193 RepID=UPI002156FEAC|nr:molybdate ABC transporter substrate-binding protein [Salipiger pentaromativorans]MCR8547448.1 molybdate ABC transporter substrate-binding protein [Salipiger pentaromativorans]